MGKHTRLIERNAEIVRLLRAGETKAFVARRFGLTIPRVYQIAADAQKAQGGPKSQRKDSFDARLLAIRGMRAAGADWDEIAAEISRCEGAEVTAQDLKSLFMKGGAQGDRSIREIAIAAYGKERADDVAARHGVSRNVIIGHWFRARQLGLIAQ